LFNKTQQEVLIDDKKINIIFLEYKINPDTNLLYTKEDYDNCFDLNCIKNDDFNEYCQECLFLFDFIELTQPTPYGNIKKYFYNYKLNPETNKLFTKQDYDNCFNNFCKKTHQPTPTPKYKNNSYCEECLYLFDKEIIVEKTEIGDIKRTFYSYKKNPVTNLLYTKEDLDLCEEKFCKKYDDKLSDINLCEEGTLYIFENRKLFKDLYNIDLEDKITKRFSSSHELLISNTKFLLNYNSDIRSFLDLEIIKDKRLKAWSDFVCLDKKFACPPSDPNFPDCGNKISIKTKKEIQDLFTENEVKTNFSELSVLNEKSVFIKENYKPLEINIETDFIKVKSIPPKPPKPQMESINQHLKIKAEEARLQTLEYLTSIDSKIFVPESLFKELPISIETFRETSIRNFGVIFEADIDYEDYSDEIKEALKNSSLTIKILNDDNDIFNGIPKSKLIREVNIDYENIAYELRQSYEYKNKTEVRINSEKFLEILNNFNNFVIQETFIDTFIYTEDGKPVISIDPENF